MNSRLALVGPIAPLRGGIAAHSARLVEALLRDGSCPQVISYSRLYPSFGFPGTSPLHYSSVPQRENAAQAVASNPDARGVAAQAADLKMPVRVEAVLDTLDPRSWRRAAALLARLDPARVVAQWWHPVAAPALAWLLGTRPRTSVTIVCHNLLPHERFPLARALARMTLGRAGLIVCHSRVVADQVLSLLPRARVETVALPPLIDVGAVVADLGAQWQASRAWAAARLGLAVGAPLVLMAGHLRSYKGVEVLLEAWKRRPRGAGDAARLALVGECYLRGSARRRVLASVNADPSIVLLNRYVDDSELVRLVSIAGVLVLPYVGASQSGILPLASALGVPCLISDVGALAEQAPNARRVTGGDVAALSVALSEMLARSHRGGSGGGATVVLDTNVADCTAGFLEQWREVVEVVSGRVRP